MVDKWLLPAALCVTPHRGQHLWPGKAGSAMFWVGFGSSCVGVLRVELASVACRVSARRPRYFSLLRQRKVPKRKASRMRCPSLRFGSAALLGSRGVWLNSPSAQTTPALFRASLRYSPTHDGEGANTFRAAFSALHLARSNAGGLANPETQVFRWRICAPEARYPRPPPCRVAGLSSAAAGGSGRALSERSEFSPTPPDASSARHRAAARTSARFFFAYFLLAKQKKVSRQPGRDPARLSNTKATSKRISK